MLALQTLFSTEQDNTAKNTDEQGTVNNIHQTMEEADIRAMKRLINYLRNRKRN